MCPLICFARQDYPKPAGRRNTVAHFFADHDPPVCCLPIILLPPFHHPWFDAGPHNGLPTRFVSASPDHVPLSLTRTRPPRHVLPEHHTPPHLLSVSPSVSICSGMPPSTNQRIASRICSRRGPSSYNACEPTATVSNICCLAATGKARASNNYRSISLKVACKPTPSRIGLVHTPTFHSLKTSRPLARLTAALSWRPRSTLCRRRSSQLSFTPRQCPRSLRGLPPPPGRVGVTVGFGH